MTYAIREMFYTLQGEGYHAGTPALFIRFAGCNLWSGRDEDRDRDATRNGAECPRWCDTDFVGGEKLTAAALGIVAANIVEEGGGDPSQVPLVVFTGGEPFLQLDAAACAAVRAVCPNATLAVETNGTVAPNALVDWICVSPKVPLDQLAITEGDEIKVVVPAYDPNDYADIVDHFEHAFVSAEAHTSEVGKSVIVTDNLRRAAEFCLRNPAWKLTLQSHKIIGVP